MLLAACEKQIDIDIDDLEPLVVVRAQNETDMPLSVNLTYSRPMFGSFYVDYDDDYFPKVTDATVTLSVNGGTVETATRDGGTYTFTHLPQPGEELSLNIEVPGKEAITATATVPLLPQVGEITLQTRTEPLDIDGNTSVDLSLFVPLIDRGGTADFYSIVMYRCDTVCYTYYDSTGAACYYDTLVDGQQYFECQDQLIVNQMNIEDAFEGTIPTFVGSEMLFNDALIDGTTHSIELMTYVYLGGYNAEGRWFRTGDGYWIESPYGSFTYVVHSTFYVEVYALSRDLYLYRQSMNSYNDDELLSFFSEPVQIHSNVDGGIGIFGVSSKKTFTYKFDLQP